MQEEGATGGSSEGLSPAALRSLSQLLSKDGSASTSEVKEGEPARVKYESEKPPRGMHLSAVKEDEAGESVGHDISSAAIRDAQSTDQQDVLEAILRRASSITAKSPRPRSKQWEISQDVLLKDSSNNKSASFSRPISSSGNHESDSIMSGSETPSASSMGAMAPPLTKKLSNSSTKAGLERLLSETSDSGAPRPNTSTKRQISLDTLAESLTKPGTASSSRQGGRKSASGRGGVILESLNPSEVRAMSGLLSSYVQRTSAGTKSRGKEGRRTPESSRLMVGAMSYAS